MITEQRDAAQLPADRAVFITLFEGRPFVRTAAEVLRNIQLATYQDLSVEDWTDGLYVVVGGRFEPVIIESHVGRYNNDRATVKVELRTRDQVVFTGSYVADGRS